MPNTIIERIRKTFWCEKNTSNAPNAVISENAVKSTFPPILSNKIPETTPELPAPNKNEVPNAPSNVKSFTNTFSTKN